MKVILIVLGIVIVFLTIVLIGIVRDEEYKAARITEINLKNTTSGNQGDISVGDSCLLLGCPENSIYIGSAKSNKYHDCTSRFAKMIKKDNLVCFRSENEAILRGYQKGDVK